MASLPLVLGGVGGMKIHPDRQNKKLRVILTFPKRTHHREIQFELSERQTHALSDALISVSEVVRGRAPRNHPKTGKPGLVKNEKP